jgi:hypothetical protein
MLTFYLLLVQLEWNIVPEGIPVPPVDPEIPVIPGFQPFQFQVVLAFQFSQSFLPSGGSGHSGHPRTIK